MVSRRQNESQQRQGTIALLPWGNVFERFFDTIGVSLDDFCERGTGGWLFGYVEALRSAGWDSVLFLVSREAAAPIRRLHTPSGTRICVLPASKPYRIVGSDATYPAARLVRDTFG